MPEGNAKSADEARRRCQYECGARCCRYLTIQIPAPKLKSDFDEIRWFLAHRDISVYVESRRWQVEVRNRCKHLKSSNLCDAYERRPDVCRLYDVEACEYPERPLHSLQLDSEEEFDLWLARRQARERRKRRARAAKKRASRTRKAE